VEVWHAAASAEFVDAAQTGLGLNPHSFVARFTPTGEHLAACVGTGPWPSRTP